jgi:thiosulfate dehydrogenase [quinone] large subunit
LDNYKEHIMSETVLDKSLLLFFRVTIGWTFLYAGAHQLLDPAWSAAGFLSHTKTFHDVFAVFSAPALLPYTNFLVQWGHLLIGLSLISGLLVRVSGVFGILLMATYYFAHMDFPYIENKLNLFVDYHLIYAGVLVYLIARHAGRVWGLDGLLSNMGFVERHPRAAVLVS